MPVTEFLNSFFRGMARGQMSIEDRQRQDQFDAELAYRKQEVQRQQMNFQSQQSAAEAARQAQQAFEQQRLEQEKQRTGLEGQRVDLEGQRVQQEIARTRAEQEERAGTQLQQFQEPAPKGLGGRFIPAPEQPLPGYPPAYEGMGAMPTGYQKAVLPPAVAKMAPEGTVPVLPTPEEIARQQRAVKEADWTTLPSTIADAFGIDKNMKVDPTHVPAFLNAYASKDKTEGGDLPTLMNNRQKAIQDFRSKGGKIDSDKATEYIFNGRLDKAPTINVGDQESRDDAKVIASSIIDGSEPPPDLTARTKYNMMLAAELKRVDPKFNASTARLDWLGTQKYVGTLQGDQQVRLRQSIERVPGLLAQVERLYNDWQQTGLPSGYKLYNKGALMAAANSKDPNISSTANNLVGKLAEVAPELSVIYSQGNTSTDKGMENAHDVIRGDWNDKTFRDALDQIKEGLEIRRRSIKLAQPESRYLAKPDVTSSVVKPADVQRIKFSSSNSKHVADAQAAAQQFASEKDDKKRKAAIRSALEAKGYDF